MCGIGRSKINREILELYVFIICIGFDVSQCYGYKSIFLEFVYSRNIAIIGIVSRIRTFFLNMSANIGIIFLTKVSEKYSRF